MLSTTFPVIGMKCNGCAARITQALTQLDGVKKADVSLANGSVTVVSEGNGTLLLQVRARINSLGYGIDNLKLYPNKGCQCVLPQVEG